MSKERQIRKISLNVSGLKGLILEGTYETYKDNKLVTNGFKDTLKTPIHFDLEDKIKELRFFALEICGLIADSTPKHEKATLLEQADIISIEFEKGLSGFFKLKSNSRVFDTKNQNLTTPKVDVNDNYEYYDTVMNIIEAILVEVDQYAKGLKKVTDEEIMMSYVRHGKDKNVDISALNEMSAEERADYCQSVLEKLGCLVIRPDEVSDEDVEEEVVEETEEPESGDLFDASNMNLRKKEEESLLAGPLMATGIKKEYIEPPVLKSELDLKGFPEPIKIPAK